MMNKNNMKKLITIVFLLVNTFAFATKHYVSSLTGNDGNTGLTTGSPWQSLAKVNALSTVLGDTVFFRAAETFKGQLKPLTGNVVFDRYDVGANPIISGFSLVTAWTLIAGNIYRATPNISFPIKASCNIFTINGYPKAVGRTPNAGSYFTYSSASSTTITSASFAGSYAAMTGAEVCFKNNSYSASKGAITSQSGTTITYAKTYGIDNNDPITPGPVSSANYGCFLQRFVGSLDQDGEWYYNASTNEVRLFSTVNPNTLVTRMSYIDTLVNLSAKSNITLNHLTLEGGNVYGVYSSGSTNITVKNCSFINNTRAIHMWYAHHPIIDGNTFKHSFNSAIMIKGSSTTSSKQINITNNNIDSTGLLIGMGLQWSDFNLKGIIAFTNDSTAGGNYLNIIGNVVRNTGFDPIQFQGSNVIVRRNITDSFCSKLQDGGGIYTFTKNSALNTINYVNRLIDSNFISNALGAAWGTAGDTTLDVVGAYNDDQAANTTWIHNTIWNIPGPAMQMNTPHDNIFRDNVVYNCKYFMSLNKRHVAEVYNNFIDSNTMYQKFSTQANVLSFDDGLNLPTPHTFEETLSGIATITNNYISNRLNAGYTYYYKTTYNVGSYIGPNNITLATWRAPNISQEAGSVLPPLTLTDDNTTLYGNPASTSKVVSFEGLSKMAPDGTIYNNSVTIPAFSSIILIDNGLAAVPGTTRTFRIKRLP